MKYFTRSQKFVLEEDIKAYRGSSGIAVLFL